MNNRSKHHWIRWNWLPSFGYRRLVLLVGILFLSEIEAGFVRAGETPGSLGRQMAQQPTAPSEATRATAERIFAEGQKLIEQGTAESLQQAIGKFKEALRLWRALNEQFQEARTLNDLGFVYDSLGEKQKALEFYNQALPLSRAVGDRRGEAAILNNIGGVYDSLGEKQKALEFYNLALPLFRAVSDRAGEATTLNNIGGVYDSLGEKQKALEFYNQALLLFRTVGERAGEAYTLNNIGLVYDSLGEKQKALEFYNQALPLSRAVGDRAREATTLNNIGSVYDDLGEKQKALSFYNQALPLFRAVGNRAGEAATLNNIGSVYDDLGEKQKALEFYNQALPLSRAVGDRRGEAATLNNIGGVYDDLGEKQKALEFYNQALPLSRAVGDRRGEANTLNDIGLVYNNLGEKQKALEFYNQALPLSRAVSDRAGEANTLNNIGGVYDSLGEKQKALEFYNQALTLSRAVGDRVRETATLNNIGLVYDSLGEKQKALEFYNQALPLSRAVGDRAGEATILNNIGLVYDDLGEKQKALEFYNQALPLSRAVENLSREGNILNNIGGVYNSLGEKQKALEFYNLALPLSRAVGDRAGEAYTLNNIGSVYNSLGEKQKALEFYNQALPLFRAVGDRAGEATTLNNIGGVYDSWGEKQKALEFYNQALSLTRTVGDCEGEATILGNIAFVERDRGNLQLAQTQIEEALKIVESLRTQVISQELRTSYFASKQDAYEFYIDLLMELHKQDSSKGYDTKALEASERARARSLLELLTEARADIRQGVDPKLLEKERTLQQKLDAAQENRVKLLERQDAKEQLEANQQQIQSFLTQLEQVKDQIRATSPGYAKLKYLEPLTLPEIQQVLDDNTLLLQYSLGEERSYLWAITKTGVTSYTLPGQAELEQTAGKFHNAVSNNPPGSLNDVVEPGQSLSQLIKLDEILPLVQGKKLLIAADGALHLIPFAALPNPNSPGNYQPLMLEHEIINLPSISAIATLRQTLNRPPASKTLAVVADPVFSKTDDRVTGKERPIPCANAPFLTASDTNRSPGSALALQLQNSTLERATRDMNLGNINRLPHTRREAERILATIPNNQRTAVCDFEANRDWVTQQGTLNQYRYLLFATHSLINTDNPEESSLVLSLVDQRGESRYGLLRLGDIFNLNLNAELAILSACQTGLAKEVRGEGLIGMTRGFMYAGAKRVLVSLWNVDDEKTADLLEHFSQQVMQDNRAPGTALQAAQKQMWQTQQGTEYQHPYYWAAFTLQGEWRN